MQVQEKKDFALIEKKKLKKPKKNGESAQCFILSFGKTSAFPIIAKGISTISNTQHNKNCRIVIEKPFGHDLESAVELNQLLMELFDEEQIYRIDHF
jgi:glucose-6-phosphate 1-dehydrogenase